MKPNSAERKCEKYGITFTTQQDMEQHMELEHEEDQQPMGVT